MSTSNSVTLFVMTQKGLTFVEQVVPLYKDFIAEVVIGQDPAVQNDYSSEIAAVCDSQNVRFSFRSDFSKIDTEYAMAISWRWLIDHPAEKLIVFHDSLLPRYRGFAPLVNALINHERTIGVTAIFGAAEYDRGDIIDQSALQISYPITIAEAISAINECYVALGKSIMQALASGETLSARPQDHDQATYSLWRDDEDYRIDWSLPASKIRHIIDAVGAPYKGAYCLLDKVPARILAAQELDDVTIENRTPGKVIFIEEGLPVVVCGQGLLKLTCCVADDDLRSLLPLSKFRLRLD